MFLELGDGGSEALVHHHAGLDARQGIIGNVEPNGANDKPGPPDKSAVRQGPINVCGSITGCLESEEVGPEVVSCKAEREDEAADRVEVESFRDWWRGLFGPRQ